MASSSSSSSSSSALSFFLFTLCITLSHAQNSFRPKALVLPVVKDSATNQYVTSINQRTPLVPVKLVVDIGSRYMWVDCDDGYVSSTYRPALCGSAQCSLAKANGCGNCFSTPRPGCSNNTCGVSPYNPIIQTSTYGDLAADVLSVQSTDGSSPGQVVTVPRFLFSCAPTFLLKGLASGVKGMAGFGRTRIGLPSQFASAFSLPRRKFAICLSSSTSSNGAIFIGDGPYVFLPGTDVSNYLTYTPLIINPVSTAGSYVQGEPSYEYFIRVKSIKVNENRIPLNSSLLSIDSEGVGGTKISSVNPYTILESSIYKAVTDAFIRGTNLTRVAPVAPFGVCFSSKNVGSTRVGPAVSSIDLVLQNESVYWRIFGSNSVVSVSDKVMCLAFLDGGSNPRTSIVIGGHQLEDNLLQFDLATSRLGFTSTLFFMQTTCANFNFNSNAS